MKQTLAPLTALLLAPLLAPHAASPGKDEAPRIGSALQLDAAKLGNPAHLKVNLLNNACGLDAENVKNLRFSWRVPKGKQTAYRIQVVNGWDSGKVESAQQNGIRYAGPALVPKTPYTWKLKIWIDGHESDWVESSFETGILSERDWNGQWVGAEALKPAAQNTNQFNLIRQVFEIPVGKTVVRARAYVTAIAEPVVGRYTFAVNGTQPKDCQLLYCGMEEREYFTFDVTGIVRPGHNSFGVMFGDRGLARLLTDLVKPLASRNALICDLDVWFADGTHTTFSTGAATKGAQGGPVLEADVYDGEKYDSRREIAWTAPDFDDSQWKSGVLLELPKPDRAQLDWVKTVEIRNPVKVTEPKAGVFVFDAGTQMSGWQILKVKATAGKEIRFRFAEALNDDGTIDRTTLLEGLPAEQIDSYTTRGGEEEIWEPRLTCHGFRYMEVTGFPGTPSAETIRFRRVAGDITREQAWFDSSREPLNRLHRAFYDTELANAVTHASGCNQRGERVPWTADALCISQAAMSYFDMAQFWQTKWINIANQSVGPKGESSGILGNKVGGFNFLWGAHCVLIPWDFWLAYGDKPYLEPSYARAKQYADCCIGWYDTLDEVVADFARVGKKDKVRKVIRSQSRNDWLIESEAKWKSPDGKEYANALGPWGDWLPPDEKWDANLNLVNNAFYFTVVATTAKMAAALGRKEEGAHYAEIAEKIRAAINAKWLVKKDGKTYYGNGNQAANAIALFSGIVPQEKRTAVLDSLVARIQADGNHVSTGCMGTLALIPALAENGRSDVVFGLAVQRTEPGWIYMLDHGPGTFWEKWSSGPWSMCHPFKGGSIGAWLHRSLAGIRPAKPGYEEIEIRPQPVGDVKWVDCTIPTVRGPVTANWKIEGDRFLLTAVIPGNTLAKVYLPGESKAREVGPGTHAFESTVKGGNAK